MPGIRQGNRLQLLRKNYFAHLLSAVLSAPQGGF
jgi:hypothetical protein